MFSVRTVFVVGAGAGIDIGMPVGGGLSKAIVDMLDIWISQGRLERGDEAILQTLRRIARDSSANVNDWIAAGRMVAKGIEYTRLIHAFLNTHRHNDQVKDCAKLAIARSILEAEQPCAIAIAPDGTWKDPDRVKASWLPTLMYLLQDGVIAKQSLDDLFANFCIINFNYDRCIEQFLFQAVRDLYHVDQEQAAKLIANLTIFHPYGSVGILAWQKGARKVDFGARNYGDILGLSKEILTFNEQMEDLPTLRAMRSQLASARRIVFLGFHFHQQNMDLLKITSAGGGTSAEVYATVINRSPAEIDVMACH